MMKKLTKISLLVMISMSLNYGILNAGSSAKVSEEDKKAAENVSAQQENSEKTEATEKKEETSKAEDSEDNEEENKKSQNDEISESNEEIYEQKLTKSSKSIIKKFENFQKEIQENSNKDGADQVKYIRSKANELFLELAGDKEDMSTVEDLTIHVEDSDIQIPIRYYRPKEEPSKDLMLFVHGGGWSQGNLNTHDSLCRTLAKYVNVDVIAVDYRLSPENQYPVPLDDILTVYKQYVSEGKYDRIFICGDDAGGNLCLALCMKINENDLKKPYAQILMYPPLGSDFDSKSYQTFGESLALSKQSVMRFVENYAGKPCTDDDVTSNEKIYPLSRNDLTVYPTKTMIISAGYDVLLDGQIRFAKKLKDDGRNVKHILDKGVVHGYMTYGDYYGRLVKDNCRKIRAYLYDEKEEKSFF